MRVKQFLATIAVFIAAIFGSTSAAFARKWTDNTGKFSTEAQLLDFMDGKVTLKKVNGKPISVHVERLSTADLEHLYCNQGACHGLNPIVLYVSKKDGLVLIDSTYMAVKPGELLKVYKCPTYLHTKDDKNLRIRYSKCLGEVRVLKVDRREDEALTVARIVKGEINDGDIIGAAALAQYYPGCNEPTETKTK